MIWCRIALFEENPDNIFPIFMEKNGFVHRIFAIFYLIFLTKKKIMIIYRKIVRLEVLQINTNKGAF